MAHESGESNIYYYVDEAGDGTLFNSKGKLLVGQENGSSRYFIVGLLHVENPDHLAKELTALRLQLLADPYFAQIPSMQVGARKTALSFHAKDDVPEVRREVFKLLRQHAVSFWAVVKDKLKVHEYVRQRNQRDPAYRYNQNELYDALVRRLFKDRLHQHSHNRVMFATRGHADRTNAFAQALEIAQKRFAEQWQRDVNSTVEVIPSNPPQTPELQAVDYFLWALQRLYERHEERYWSYVQPQAKLVIDMDDTRNAKYGVYYTRKKPLTLAALMESGTQEI